MACSGALQGSEPVFIHQVGAQWGLATVRPTSSGDRGCQEEGPETPFGWQERDCWGGGGQRRAIRGPGLSRLSTSISQGSAGGAAPWMQSPPSPRLRPVLRGLCWRHSHTHLSMRSHKGTSDTHIHILLTLRDAHTVTHTHTERHRHYCTQV